MWPKAPVTIPEAKLLAKTSFREPGPSCPTGKIRLFLKDCHAPMIPNGKVCVFLNIVYKV
jgi:hypothetical protein